MKRIWLKRCNFCNQLNPNDNSRCSNCNRKWGFSFGEVLGTSLINDSDTTSVWACPKCKFINAQDNKSCGSCMWKESTGACFLTTIVVQELGMADNCYELNSMRRLRNEYLLTFKKGQEIMDDYQNKSEFVTYAIRKMDNKSNFCQNVHQNYIVSVVKLIEQDRFEEATKRYLEMVDFVMKNINQKVKPNLKHG